MNFARVNQKAMLLLTAATHDYAAARCLLLNGLFSGLPVGAQCIEKYLKAAILLAAPSRIVRKMGHNLSTLTDEFVALLPNSKLTELRPVAERFLSHYQTRYPDNPNQSGSRSTGEREQLDSFVVALNVDLPCHRNVKMRVGLFVACTHSLDPNCEVTSDERWIRRDNAALAQNWPKIISDYFATMREIYPDTPELHG